MIPRPLLVFTAFLALAGASAAPLPGTAPLNQEGDLSDQMIAGVDAWLLQRIAESPAGRAQYWHRDFSSPEAYSASVDPNREHLKKMIGAVDERVEGDLEEDRVESLARSSNITVRPIRWPVLEGVWGVGLELRHQGENRGTVIALGDADQTPEMLAGLVPGLPPEAQWARRAAELGFDVLVPLLIDRSDTASGNPALGKWTNQPHREWIYRQAFQMGRHIIGYEVEKVLALVDRHQDGPLGIAGYGEGGLLALYAAAIDPRLQACLVSGYFQPREGLWREPIYRNVFGLLREFGDAEIASLVAPRPLFIQSSPGPRIQGPPPATPERQGAAAGALETPPAAEIERELDRARHLLPAALQKIARFGESEPALEAFLASLEGGEPLPPAAPIAWRTAPRPEGPWARQVEQVQELERHVQRLVEDSERVRQDRFLGAIPVIQEIEKSRHFNMHEMDERPPERFTSETPKFRREFWEEVLGKLPDPSVPPNPRTRQVYDRPKWTGYDVVLDVWPGVFAWGQLCVPKDLQPGEQRPVLVCQHGRNGLPQDMIEGDKEAYNNVAAVLADQGFITFSPHNLYRGEDKYRFIQRKANAIGASMFSVIAAQHQQCLNWLKTLPFVDPRRIAFYGLSYGGEAAVRLPAVLEDYCLSICSGDFNDWTRKVATTRDAHSFMFTKEWEMPYWNMGATFSYAELTYLIFPRPFMVERGHHDMVAPDSWVAGEYAKTRYLYDQFGLGDRTQIEFFNGGHTIHGVGSFEFLHQQLGWPKAK